MTTVERVLAPGVTRNGRRTLMQRSSRIVPALLLAPLIGCQDQSLSPAAGRSGPSYTTTASAPTCPASPTVTVTHEAALHAAIAAAQPGDVIAVRGTITLTAGDTIATDGVTLTCATPGSGLVATDLSVLDVVTVTARGVTVDGLVLDASRAADAALLVLNDGETAFAQDVRFTNNTVTCAQFNLCVFIVGGTGAVVSDNQFQATDAFSGIHLQANGPDPNVRFPIRIDGARIERNTIVALTPSLGVRFGAIRPFDADSVVIADNVISGFWRNGISPARLAHSQIQRNQISGAAVDGIRTSSFGGALRGVAENLFASNQVSGSGRAGIFADRACSNRFASNDLRGNTDDLGLLLTDTTGANVVAGVENAVVVDNGAFDCDGDGRTDPNFITGGVAHHRPAPPDTTGAPPARSRNDPQPL
jgi:Right handed beta helix region